MQEMQQHGAFLAGTFGFFWDKTKHFLYGQSRRHLLRILELQMKASSLRHEDLLIIEFFIMLRIIWDELNNLRP